MPSSAIVKSPGTPYEDYSFEFRITIKYEDQDYERVALGYLERNYSEEEVNAKLDSTGGL